LHTAPLRAAKATDTYILGKDGVQDLEPKHTFHGFQFADVVTEAKVVKAVAIAITSDNPDRAEFESSHKLLNKLHSNVLWSLRDNYVSIPTDCPQRDERLGWTGDAQAFIYAANTLVDENAFFRSWLKDLASEQTNDGKVPHVIPDILEMQYPRLEGGNPFPDNGAAGWGDAATVIPWAQYQSFGDVQILRNQLVSMRKWVDYFSDQCVDNVFGEGIMQLGDWLDPDAPEDKPFLAKVSSRFVASAYISHSARLVARAEELVGTKENSVKYQRLSDDVATATWNLLGSEARKTTSGCSLALEFRICPEAEREAVAAELAALVRKDKGAISTGFLGTPVIMDAMSQNGYFEEAYSMLLREEIRSWLYPITVGATTIWERWEAIKPDGTPSTGGSEGHAPGSEPSMISFNHYAYVTCPGLSSGVDCASTNQEHRVG
jgi:alpha-L-rhamnosidase